jgi:glycerophosphoryl diester phosphodiesterase
LVDPSQGDLAGFKAIYQITFGQPGTEVTKTLAVDLMNIRDLNRISEPAEPGDVGLGERFAMPFNTIEDVIVLDRQTLLVACDNNFPFSVGRHKGSGKPDDDEIITVRLDHPLG